jgi:MFS family permease
VRSLRPQGGLWGHADFLKLWSAETVSQFGTQVSLLALPLIAVLVLEVTAFKVALLTTIDFLPFILFSLPAGVWVDRLPRRPILVIGDVGRALCLLSIPLAYALDVLTIWQLYAVGFLVGTLTVFFDVAYQSYLPSLVRRDQLVEGNSKLEISRSSAQIGGPGLAGLLIGAITAPYAILVDAISFLGSAGFIFGIRKRETPPERARDEGGNAVKPSMKTEVTEGLRYVLGNPHLRWIAACTGLGNFFGNVIFALLIVWAVRSLGLTAALIGLVFTISNVGSLVAALTATKIAARLGVGPTIVMSAAVFGPGMLLFPLASKAVALPYLIAALTLGIFGSVTYNITQVSYRQAITPERLQGRMNAVMRFIVWGALPLGSLTGGVLGSAIGLHAAIWIGAIGGSFSVLPVALSSVRSIRTMPEPEAVPLADELLPGGVSGAQVPTAADA